MSYTKITLHIMAGGAVSFALCLWMLVKGMGIPLSDIHADATIPVIMGIALSSLLVASVYGYVMQKGRIRRISAFSILYCLLIIVTLYVANLLYMWWRGYPLSFANPFQPLWLADFVPYLRVFQIQLIAGTSVITIGLPTVIMIISYYQANNKKGAHFQTPSEMRRNKLFENVKTDVFYGKKQGQWVSHPTVALTVIAAARSGKSSAIIIANAKKRMGIGSDVFNDNRGELYPILKPGYEEQGYTVWRWSPFNPDGSASMNALLFIRFTPDHLIDDLDVIVDMIVPANNTDNSTNDFFRTVSCDLIRALIIYQFTKVGKDKDRLTMQHIIEIGTTGNLSDLLEKILNESDQFHNHISIALKMFVRKIVEAEDPKSKSNALLSAQVNLTKLYSPKILKTLSGNDIDVTKIRHEKMAIFIEIPKGKKEKMKNHLALFYQLLITSVTEEGDFMEDKHQRITCYLDEFGNMAKIPALPEASTELGAFGLTFIFILQNMAQARSVYGDNVAQTIFGAGSMMLGSTNSMPDTKYFSDSMGKYEKKIKVGKGDNQHTVTKDVDLMTHDDIRTMSKKYWLVLLEGQYPLKLRKGYYFLDKELRVSTIAETKKFKVKKWFDGWWLAQKYKIKSVF